MTKFKKMAAILLSVVMIVCCFSVQAAAVGPYDFAQKLKPLEYASDVLNDKQTEVIYKIVLPSSGKIRFHCTDCWASDWHPSNPVCELTDANGKVLSSPNHLDSCQITAMVERDFKIPKKGTYYWKISKGLHDVYWNNMYYTFIPDEDAKISIVINLKVGQSLDLSAAADNYSGKVAWKSTKTSVATVNNGTVKAKKAGTTKIQVYMSNGDYEEITVKVKK